jgi:hypothetical protein
MDFRQLGAARLFASHYQLVISDDPGNIVGDDENWNEQKVARGFAGRPEFRMIGTDADLNDHWVELVAADTPPAPEDWQRIICVHFRCTGGRIHVMSVVENDPPITAEIVPGDYAVYAAAQNIGVDQLSLGEEAELSDAELAARKDLEWYRLFLVPGLPAQEGFIIDRPAST